MRILNLNEMLETNLNNNYYWQDLTSDQEYLYEIYEAVAR